MPTFPCNLDTMTTPEELDAIAADESTPGRLRLYARAKAKATRFRLAGEISNALHAEEICENIFLGLPESLRW